MYFCAKALGPAIVSPQRALTAFFVMPLVSLIFNGGSPAAPLMVLDAIIGVGAVAYVFLIVLRKSQYLGQAFLAAALVIMLYSVARMLLFGGVLTQSFNEGLSLMQEQMPALFDEEYMDLARRLWMLILPAFWGMGQIFALLIGFLIFHKTIKVPFKPAEMKFPIVFNILILLILPLYFFEAGRDLFINSLILLCTIPLIQGFFSVWAGISKVVSNIAIKSIIMFFILIYAFVPLTLIGFADGWMNFSNTKRGGNTA
ncbi:MAG: hypothetical protein LHW64_02825 [Candidatus Cloacimonetes bacterium]|nr:hypothetical protein [Candidatus Cloacimonadota bacterium]MCB5286722.1 hypothetical protein [Candidatus Cloacimonadota bacterium]MCK9185193.1 hypothetical protein [Candidatus Cloacimonadota bacterium]MDY0229043.1 hypothetical protein [Candidatus Cloacimonadaceae bacterium]